MDNSLSCHMFSKKKKIKNNNGVSSIIIECSADYGQ